jgi:DNA repair protein RadA/Sms
VLGGGIVEGSLILLGGDPGVGKSTLLLDAGLQLARQGKKVLYVSGEESAAQTGLRARRLGRAAGGLLIMTEIDLNNIIAEAKTARPDLLVIDSVQTMYNAELPTAAGSVGQIRECTSKLLRLAKEENTAVAIIGHVTKDGAIAGPRLLEHMVDVVLQFEGERSYAFRLLRALKNRFGATSESGIFSMEEHGLAEIKNPAGLFLEEREEETPGSLVCACLEGTRPVLVEVQALVAPTPYGMPRRASVGFDYNRVNMLLAILEKRLGFDFGAQDAYVNIVGGFKINEPAADLAVAAALASSYRNTPVSRHTLILGEVGLTGEIRRISQAARRIKEAAGLGFARFVVPRGGDLKLLGSELPGVVQVRNLREALREIGIKTP